VSSTRTQNNDRSDRADRSCGWDLHEATLSPPHAIRVRSNINDVG
jgi:hypothetical protein